MGNLRHKEDSLTIPAKEHERWLLQARNVAGHLKQHIECPELVGRDPLRLTFGFDAEQKGVDLIKLEIPRSLVYELTVEELTGALYALVLAAVPRAEVIPSHGLTCLVGPSDADKCGKPASGGLRVTLFATPTIQKRYGRKPLLSLVLDLPTCVDCHRLLTPWNTMTDEQWRAFSRHAQQRNSGILADRSQTVIDLCPFEDPDYVALRRANQTPAQAAPQPEGAGDGLTEELPAH